jgi:anti-anti-sigma factor
MEPVRLVLENLPNLNGNHLVTRLEGKLALETVSNFLQTARAETAPFLILDMSGVSFLDSAGVGALVQLFVHRRNSGQGFALAALTQQGNAVMQVSGLLKLLPIFPSVEAAIAQHA